MKTATEHPPASDLVRALNALSMGVMMYKAVKKGKKICDFKWTFVNDFVEKMTGRDLADFLSKSMLELYPEHLENGMFETYVQVAETGATFSDELHFPAKVSTSGFDTWIKTVVSKSDDGLIVVFENITERKQREKAIEAMAYQDALTGLHNRRYLDEHAPQLFAQAQRQNWTLALLYFDLVNFKNINDSFGHKAGDDLLRSLAARLLTVKRQEDTLCRLGGDEFALLLSDTDEDQAKQVAERLAQQLYMPFTLHGQPQEMGVSIGIAISSQETCGIGDLIARADEAMYRAKERKEEERFAISL